MKIEINGEEYGLYYSLGAHIAFDNWAVNHPKASYAEGVMEKFQLMAAAYNSKNKIKGHDAPGKAELSEMPNYVFNEIMGAVLECEKEDSTRKVEVEPKNAKRTGKSS